MHFVANGNLHSRVMSVEKFKDEKKTGANIKQALENAFSTNNISLQLLLNNAWFVTDEGSNMIAALSHYKRLPCSCHMLATVLRHVLQLESLSKTVLPLNPNDKVMQHVKAIQSAVAEVKSLVAYFKRSGLNNKLPTSLKQANDTRWNSTLLMLESYLKNVDDIKQILIVENQEKRLEHVDSITIKCLVDFLQPFLLATKQLEGDSKPTINYVYLWFSKLKRSMKSCVTDNDLLAFLKKRGLAALEKKFQIQDIHRLAFFLNPKFKALVPFSFEEKNELKSCARDLLSSLFERSPIVHDLDHSYAPPLQRPRLLCTLDDEFAEWQEPSSTEVSEDEVSYYASMDIDDAITNMHCETGAELNLLKFWSCSQIKSVLPKLSKLAIGVFSIPATSSASERAFSICTTTVSKQRTLLSSGTVDGILVSNSHAKKP